jgi:SAM-dependent methyltransferase
MTDDVEALDRSAKSSYEALAPAYDDLTASYEHEMWLGSILAGLEGLGLRGTRLLDVGCGTGESFMPMLARGWQVTGCDVSPAMLERAREKAGDSVPLHVADMRALPRFGEFDLVWALGAPACYLASAAEMEKALAGMRGNLAEEGLLAFDLDTLTGLRRSFTEDKVVEGGGRRLIWHGRSSPDAPPGTVFEAGIEEEGGGIEPHVHRLRHFPEEEVRAALAAAGLRCRAVFGHGDDVALEQPLDDDRHTRAVYVADNL